MVSEILNLFVDEILRLNPIFTEGFFIRPIADLYVKDQTEEQYGLSDSRHNYFYVRETRQLVYTENRKKAITSCNQSNVASDINITIGCRLVIVTYGNNLYAVEERMRETFCSMDLNKTNISKKRNAYFMPRQTSFNQEMIVAEELKSKPTFRSEMQILAIDGDLTYSWVYDSNCNPINLCQTPIASCDAQKT